MPTLRDRALIALGTWAIKAAARAGGSPHRAELLDSITQAAQVSYPDLSIFEHQARLMAASPWVYIAVGFIAREGAQVEFEVFRRTGDHEEQAKGHPFLDLLNAPNTYQSRYELMEALFGFRELVGNAYWFVDRAGQTPLEIIPLRPDRLRIVPGSNSKDMVAGYVYTVSGQEVPLDAEEIIHFKRWHPMSDYYGLSPLQAAAVEAQSDLAMAQWNRQFFARDMAIPAGVVNIKSLIDNTTYDALKREWQAQYGGLGRKTAFLRGAEIEFQTTGLNHQEMDFIQSRQFAKETIYQVFGVPPGLLDKNATEANALAAERTFADKTLWPIAVAIGATLTRLARYFEPDLIVRPKDFRVKDTAMQRAEIQTAAPFLTINEVRERYYQAPPLWWGHIPASGAGAVMATGKPVGSANGVIKPQELATPDQPIDKPPVKMIDTLALVPRITVTRAMQSELDQFARFAAKRLGTAKAAEIEDFDFLATPEPVALAYHAFIDIADDPDDLAVLSAKIMPADKRVSVSGVADPYAKEKEKAAKALKKATLAALTKLQSDVVAGIRHVGKDGDYAAYFNGKWWQSALANLTSALYGPYYDILHAAAVDYADVTAMRTGIGYDPAILAPDVAEQASEWTTTTVRGLVQTTRDGLNALLARWSNAAKATPLLGDLISAVQESPLFGAGRADIIADTEVTGAYALASLIGATAVGRSVGLSSVISAEQLRSILPAHPGCVCFVTDEFQYDKADKLVSVDMRWHTLKDGHNICVVCDGRDNKLVSDIVKKGL
jgi:HK97 family phage portal protein